MHSNRKTLSHQALQVVGSPRPDDRPDLRLLAWAVLKAERGQSVRQSRLRLPTVKPSIVRVA